MKKLILTIAAFSFGFLMLNAQGSTTQEQETTIKSKSPSIQQKIESSQPSYKMQPEHIPSAKKQSVSTTTVATENQSVKKTTDESVKSATPAVADPTSIVNTKENVNNVPETPSSENSQNTKPNEKSKSVNNKK